MAIHEWDILGECRTYVEEGSATLYHRNTGAVIYGAVNGNNWNK